MRAISSVSGAADSPSAFSPQPANCPEEPTLKSLIIQALPGDPRLLAFLLAFVVIFGAVVAWQWRPAGRAEQERLAMLPLTDPD